MLAKHNLLPLACSVGLAWLLAPYVARNASNSRGFRVTRLAYLALTLACFMFIWWRLSAQAASVATVLESRWLLFLLPHGLPEFTAFFLPLAAAVPLGERLPTDPRAFLLPAFLTAVALVLIASAVETFVTPALLNVPGFGR
jgi:hypothetical protein